MINKREKELKRRETISKQREEEMQDATFHPVTNTKKSAKNSRVKKPKSSHHKIDRVSCKEDIPSASATNYQPKRNQNTLDSHNNSPTNKNNYIPADRESPFRADPIVMRGKGRKNQPYENASDSVQDFLDQDPSNQSVQ